MKSRAEVIKQVEKVWQHSGLFIHEETLGPLIYDLEGYRQDIDDKQVKLKQWVLTQRIRYVRVYSRFFIRIIANGIDWQHRRASVG